MAKKKKKEAVTTTKGRKPGKKNPGSGLDAIKLTPARAAVAAFSDLVRLKERGTPSGPIERDFQNVAVQLDRALDGVAPMTVSETSVEAQLWADSIARERYNAKIDSIAEEILADVVEDHEDYEDATDAISERIWGELDREIDDLPSAIAVLRFTSHLDAAEDVGSLIEACARGVETALNDIAAQAMFIDIDEAIGTKAEDVTWGEPLEENPKSESTAAIKRRVLER